MLVVAGFEHRDHGEEACEDEDERRQVHQEREARESKAIEQRPTERQGLALGVGGEVRALHHLRHVVEEIARDQHRDGGEEEGEAPVAVASAGDADTGGEAEYDDEAPPEPGADEQIATLAGSDDQPLDVDWQAAALETDSFADVGTSTSGGDDGVTSATSSA